MTTSLLSTHPTSDSGLHIHLHPLILLTLSDYITRHTLQNYTKPIIGALLGQQNGRTITLEHAFECEVTQQGPNSEPRLHEAWFKDRLQQYKDVHQAPALELVGWFTTAPATGPEAVHVGVHQQVLQTYNETAVMLAFHPTSVLQQTGAVGGKLPLTIYESVYESPEGPAAGKMDVDGVEAPLEMRFRELPFVVETGEAEMIGVDFVARGGGNAMAVAEGAERNGGKGQVHSGEMNGKGKGVAKDGKVLDDSSILSAEDEELIASLAARANAVKMLHTRIRLLKAYLTSLPLSYLTTPVPQPTPSATSGNLTPPHTDTSTSAPSLNHPLLRSILALLSRLPLLLPPSHISRFKQETLAEKADVELVALLGAMGRSIKDAKEMGRKFAVVDSMRGSGKRGVFGAGAGGADIGGGEDEFFGGGGAEGSGSAGGRGMGMGEFSTMS